MCKLRGHIVRWMFGGVLYGILEILWRGCTHWTMLLLAALLCIPLDLANERIPWAMPLWLQAVLGGLTVTAAELAAGLVLNRWLGLAIWDYSWLARIVPFDLFSSLVDDALEDMREMLKTNQAVQAHVSGEGGGNE